MVKRISTWLDSWFRYRFLLVAFARGLNWILTRWVLIGIGDCHWIKSNHHGSDYITRRWISWNESHSVRSNLFLPTAHFIWLILPTTSSRSLYYFAPICLGLNLLVLPIVEGLQPFLEIYKVGVPILLFNAAMTFALNLSSVWLIGSASGLVLTLAGVVKDVSWASPIRGEWTTDRDWSIDDDRYYWWRCPLSS